MGGYHVRCQGCDYEQSVRNLSGYVAYRMEEPPELYLKAQLAWCADCGQVVNAEDLRPMEIREEPTPEGTSRVDLRHARRNNKNAQRYNEMLKVRCSPPRCLQCGGVDITPVRWQGPNWTVRHPACGGELLSGGNIYSRPSPETDIYTPEGKFLERVPYL